MAKKLRSRDSGPPIFFENRAAVAHYIRLWADDAILEKSEEPLQLTSADLPDTIYALDTARMLVHRMFVAGGIVGDLPGSDKTKLEHLLRALQSELFLLHTGKKSRALSPTNFAKTPLTSHPELWRMRLEALSFASALRDEIDAKSADSKTIKLVRATGLKCSASALDDWRRELRERLIPDKVFPDEPWLGQSRIFAHYKWSYRDSKGGWVAEGYPLRTDQLKRRKLVHVMDPTVSSVSRVARLDSLATEVITPIANRIAQYLA